MNACTTWYFRAYRFQAPQRLHAQHFAGGAWAPDRVNKRFGTSLTWQLCGATGCHGGSWTVPWSKWQPWAEADLAVCSETKQQSLVGYCSGLAGITQ
eukprot:6280347-Amphidinium_carterae.1